MLYIYLFERTRLQIFGNLILVQYNVLNVHTVFLTMYQYICMQTHQTNVGQLVLASSNWWVWTTQQHVGKLLARIETSSIFANGLPTCCFVVHTHQFLVCRHELANISLTCEGCLAFFFFACVPGIGESTGIYDKSPNTGRDWQQPSISSTSSIKIWGWRSCR